MPDPQRQERRGHREQGSGRQQEGALGARQRGEEGVPRTGADPREEEDQPDLALALPRALGLL